MVHENRSASVSPSTTASCVPLSPTDSRVQAFEEWDKLRAQEVDGAVDHLKSMLDQERTHYTPCMDYLAAIAASRVVEAAPSSSLTHSSSSTRPASHRPSSTTSGSHLESSVGIIRTVNRTAADRDRVNEAWRHKLCEWCFEVVDHFGMEREVVSIAMNYLDRMVAKTLMARPAEERYLARRDYQLVVVAALYVAAKLHGETDEIDMDRKRLNVDVFVELSRGIFQVKTLEAMERNILFNLDWHLNPPTPLKFIACLMRLMPVWSKATKSIKMEDEEKDRPSFKVAFKAIFDVAMYLTELSVCASTFAFHSRNSVVAYASILCSMEALRGDLPLPYDARVRFINNVAEATGLYPEDKHVRAIRNLLMELCPAIQERDVASLIVLSEEDTDEDELGSISPVCVSRLVPPEDLTGGRKRSRM